jgi:hypothetical protein
MRYISYGYKQDVLNQLSPDLCELFSHLICQAYGEFTKQNIQRALRDVGFDEAMVYKKSAEFFEHKKFTSKFQDCYMIRIIMWINNCSCKFPIINKEVTNKGIPLPDIKIETIENGIKLSFVSK